MPSNFALSGIVHNLLSPDTYDLTRTTPKITSGCMFNEALSRSHKPTFTSIPRRMSQHCTLPPCLKTTDEKSFVVSSLVFLFPLPISLFFFLLSFFEQPKKCQSGSTTAPKNHIITNSTFHPSSRSGRHPLRLSMEKPWPCKRQGSSRRRMWNSTAASWDMYCMQQKAIDTP